MFKARGEGDTLTLGNVGTKKNPHGSDEGPEHQHEPDEEPHTSTCERQALAPHSCCSPVTSQKHPTATWLFIHTTHQDEHTFLQTWENMHNNEMFLKKN